MKHKKLLTLATLAGLTLGGLSVASVASAQGYGGEQDAPAAEASTEEADVSNNIVQVQDTEGDDTESETTENDGDRDGRHGGGCNLDDEAAAIGIDTAELEAAIADGQTIAEVAEANGVDADTVIDALVEEKAERLAGKVEEGRLTQEEADAKLASSTEKITNKVNGVTEEATA